MSSITIDELLQKGIEGHRAGRLAEAEGIYRQILSQQPNNAGALHALGVLTCQAGKLEESLELIRRVIAVKPKSAEAHNNLGVALKDLNRCDEAIAAYAQALQLKPAYADAHNNLGAALCDKGRFDEAIAAFQRAVELRPDYVEAFNNLGVALTQKGMLDEAIVACCRAVELKPDFAAAHNSLGNALRGQGKLNDAVLAYANAIRFKSDSAQAYYNLGIALNDLGRAQEAAAAYTQSIKLKPDAAETHNNLGNALDKLGKFEESFAAYATAVKLNPDYAGAQNNLGVAYQNRGQIDEALACFSRAMALEPAEMPAHSNYLYALHFHPDFSASKIYEEHCRWNQTHAEPLNVFQPHGNVRLPERKLRIGYVSCDLREHPVGRFFLPLALAHDAKQFQVVCYSGVSMPDNLTRQLRERVTLWREVSTLSDEQLSRQICKDQVDILVDLGGHTAGNRLAMFARKPAPVQVTWLGYPDTTGLSRIDYRLTDIHSDPPGLTERYNSEQLIRLPETFLCFRPDDENGSIVPAPALERGYVTFASFNILPKVNVPLIQLWSRILLQVPGSRLLLKTKYLGDSSARQRLFDLFSACNVPPDRLDLRGATSSHAEHLRQYDHVDIALDTFPYHGTTTTCEALWMGVPVVTLIGDRHQSRVGESLLSNIGLSELVAGTPDDYVRIAVELAGDLPRLSALRGGLREKMRRSPLMDAARFARNVEGAYRQMWQQWCTTGA